MNLKFKVSKPKGRKFIGTLKLDPKYTLSQETVNSIIIELKKLGYNSVLYLGYE